VLDTEMLERAEYTDNETGGRITFIPLEEEPLINDIMKYDINTLHFRIPK
jgi:hypothetical protein